MPSDLIIHAHRDAPVPAMPWALAHPSQICQPPRT